MKQGDFTEVAKHYHNRPAYSPLEPMFYAITHNNFGAILLLLKYGAILDKEYLEESNKDFSKEALEFLASLL
ncbi:hypothetical protein RB97_06750 [Campylobacter jejuni]|nr:hypothetical protein RB97_06750 [Campylobacter jejuni]